MVVTHLTIFIILAGMATCGEAAIVGGINAVPVTMMGNDSIIPKSERDWTEELEIDGSRPWGTWGTAEFCPEDYFVTGFSIKIQDYAGWRTDDTALNTIKLLCNHKSFKGNGVASKDAEFRSYEITSLQGSWGEWKSSHSCSSGGKMKGVRLYSDKDEGAGGDDLAASGLEMQCENGSFLSDDSNIVEWGQWSNLEVCSNTDDAICGLKTKVDPDSYSVDETALNSVNMYC